MNMTVAIIVATVVVRAVRKAKMAIGNVAQRVKIESGVRNIETKQVQAPVRKRANIMREARRTSERASMTFWGKATGNHDELPSKEITKQRILLVAPASNSLSMIDTGSNQYNVTGLLHSVISFP